MLLFIELLGNHSLCHNYYYYIIAILIFVSHKREGKTCVNRAPDLKHPLPFLPSFLLIVISRPSGASGIITMILVKSQSGITTFPETNQHNSPIEVSYKQQTWNAALLKILSSGLVRITFFPLHSLVFNQEPYRSCPSDRVPRGRVTRFSALQRFQRNFLGKISFNKGDGVATQTLFMLAIIFRHHWYKTVLNTCLNGTKWCKRRIWPFASLYSHQY